MKQIREMKPEELNKKLIELKKELSTLKTAKVTGGAANKLSRLSVVRKLIARVLTVINTNRKLQLKKQYENAKYKPKELRPKLTRKLRRALTPRQQHLKTLREVKHLKAYPVRKFFIVA